MTILLAVLGVGCGASCIWLNVRLVNRCKLTLRARWLAVGIIAVPFMYIASCGPVSWLVQAAQSENVALRWYLGPSYSLQISGPSWLSEALFLYESACESEAERDHNHDMLELRRSYREIEQELREGSTRTDSAEDRHTGVSTRAVRKSDATE